ncbi:MAG TPA: FHA domain-containing protein [Verrucomicrobiae bacterium]|nr:FHA domain-containing protein [Verrucomicrobiae bacterium]
MDAATLDPSKVVVCLRGTGQGFHGKLFVVPREGAQIGRMPDCNILLNHPTISRYHCRIDVSPEGARVKDLGSVNGTWVNGTMGMESWLHQGDVLRIGEVNFVIEIKSLAELNPSKPPVATPPVDTVTTRLMGVRDGKSRPIKYEHLKQGERPSQMTRLADLFRGRNR